MGLIAAISAPVRVFELGAALGDHTGLDQNLESLVLLGTTAIPIFCLSKAQTGFMDAVRETPTVSQLQLLGRVDATDVFSLEWDVANEPFFTGLRSLDATVVNAEGHGDHWTICVAFQRGADFESFRAFSEEHDLDLGVTALYTETNPVAGPDLGVTPPQREALRIAVSRGYYDIPRKISTQALANELGISDQAVTERLRRAIENVSTNTVLYDES